MLAPLEAIQLDAIELAVALELMVKIKQPTMIWGPPGIGKSDLVDQLAQRLNYGLMDFRALYRNPVDVGGMPHVLYENGPGKIPSREPTKYDHIGFTVFSRPDLIVRDGRVIIFLDEINAAPPEVQAALYQLILDRCIGPHKLGDEVVILCAGNRTNDRGHVEPMPSPLADRLQHYDMAVNLPAWEEWAVPAKVHPLIIAYLRIRDKMDDEEKLHDWHHPELIQGQQAPRRGLDQEEAVHCGMLHRFNPRERSSTTPRSWARASTELYAIEAAGLGGTHIEKATLAGKIGRAGATELCGFAEMFRSGLSIDAILRNPDTAPTPTDPAMRCAIATSLARRTTERNIDNVMTYAMRLPEEYRVRLVKDAERRDPTLASTGAFVNFGITHKEIMA